MTSVFSSVVWPSKARRPSSTALAESADDEVDLRELNAGLQALADLFPDIHPDVFREMLSSFSKESRLEVITEALLKNNNTKWVRGRYRMPHETVEEQAVATRYKYRSNESTKDTRGAPLAVEDTFRSQAYREAAKQALYQEFSGLSHATIKAVLAEYNWSYTMARPTLLVLSSKSWRASITAFFLGRNKPSAKDHPLVVWTTPDSATGRPRMPMLIKTKSEELNRELYDTLIQPELVRQRDLQISEDYRLACQLNEAEAEKYDELYDCECCYIPSTLEQMSTCHTEGHYICLNCIRHTVNAALYDQGWAKNIDTRLGTLRCIAPSSGNSSSCSAVIPFDFVERAFLEEKDGADIISKFNERLTSEALLTSGLPLIRCPFCSYAEVDDLAISGFPLFKSLKLRRDFLLLAFFPLFQFFYLGIARFIVRLISQPFILAISLATLIRWLLFNSQSLSLNPLPPIEAAVRRTLRKRRGLRFHCLSPTCHRTSCIACSAPWHDPHECYASQRTSLRLTLERATTDAVKRTCPRCNLSFVKSSGCNKLVCICGYSMCYVCREGLALQGYSHFCQHFRERPGSKCGECTRCDLYRVEDEEVVVRRAREQAERDWWEKQGLGAEKGVLMEKSDEVRDARDKGMKASGLGGTSLLEKAVDYLIVL